MVDDITLKDIMAYFGMGTSEFAKDWKQLSTEDKQQIKQGLKNGTETY